MLLMVMLIKCDSGVKKKKSNNNHQEGYNTQHKPQRGMSLVVVEYVTTLIPVIFRRMLYLCVLNGNDI